MLKDPHRLPLGTQVLVRADGRVGAVVRVPGSAADDAYRVRFADHSESSFARSALAVFRHAQAEIPGGAVAVDLRRYVHYTCVVGSRAYGLDREESDTDRRGFYLPPAPLHWSLAGLPEQIEDADSQECYWEIEKLLRLALKANPGVLEALYSPIVERCSPLAAELLAMRGGFLSRRVHQTYNGYVLSQFKKLEQDLRTRGAFRWKHAMHLIRLLVSGIGILRDGTVPLRIDVHRDRLLAIRAGEVPWEEVEEWRVQLHRDFDAALLNTALPEFPDYAAADAFLLRARRLAAAPDYAGAMP